MDDFSPVNEMDPTLFATQSDAASLMPALWFLVYFVFMVLLYTLGPLLMIFGSRKNWRTKKTKQDSVGYCGFWKRVAIRIVDQISMILIVPIFLNLFFYFRDGQTLADKIYGAKLVNRHSHETASVGRLFIRPLAKFFSVLALGIGFWPAGWRAEKTAWHDGLSDTRYISTRKTLGILVILPIAVVVAFFVYLSVSAFIGYFEMMEAGMLF
ncbi:hypothetical protein HN954_03000 [bacterium]|jgi:uncharacterized RDD family membrane protein YckC|nr:hypothetical protein [bacterium]MBT6831899.1 hypothetical protein [bacterium]MBT6996372.1 hypothetical protein [bacterium]MBT7772074.1 hypothetical protein [bacterium]